MEYPFKIGQVIDLTIDRLAKGGFGVGRCSGFVVFVPYSAPGDQVKVNVTDLKKKHAFAEIVSITAPSTSRIKPKCTHYGVCGGCNWQHITYAEQLQQKQALLQWTFKDFNCEIENIIPSPREWNYRRRVQLHQKNNQVGFLKKNSHEIVQIDSCPIAREELLKNWPKQIEPMLGQKFELGVQQNLEVYKTKLDEEYPEFSQVNIEQNENLKGVVVDFVKQVDDKKKIYDLYCGSGNFSIPLAEAFPEESVVGIDSDARLIQQAQQLAQDKGLRHLEFLQKRDSAIQKMDFHDSVVILDPPRAGVVDVLLKNLIASKPTAIVYVSCDFQTALRDMRLLSANFRLKRLVPLDMFPQTDHLEIVGLLR